MKRTGKTKYVNEIDVSISEPYNGNEGETVYERNRIVLYGFYETEKNYFVL